jgi:DNA polymerase III sliding clamp (beta) subunit (PCNA family)
MAREYLSVGDDFDNIGETDLILSAKDLSKLKKFLKEWKGTGKFNAEITDHSLVVNVGSDLVSIFRINREYPRVDSVLPGEWKNEVTVTFNPELLLELYESLKDEKRQLGVNLTINLDNLFGPMKVSVEGNNLTQTGVLMPMKSDNNHIKIDGNITENISAKKESKRSSKKTA